MENKDTYYRLLTENKGQRNEIEVGEQIGLEEETTREIIAQLLAEHRIEYVLDRACNYRPLKRGKMST
ncbi:MAG TPA: hypothetical protein DCE41_31725 [Cytophagales bacterium]|nr:hypothetical protein [Cytophagales bacterium]HAA23584.1 hypothetical protein [Cytophagales bacterium]HAP60291.1 hypothetical protein [Cytophagales bacterium]